MTNLEAADLSVRRAFLFLDAKPWKNLGAADHSVPEIFKDFLSAATLFTVLAELMNVYRFPQTFLFFQQPILRRQQLIC